MSFILFVVTLRHFPYLIISLPRLLLLNNFTIILDSVVETAYQITYFSLKPFCEPNVEISMSSYKKMYQELIIPSGNLQL